MRFVGEACSANEALADGSVPLGEKAAEQAPLYKAPLRLNRGRRNELRITRKDE